MKITVTTDNLDVERGIQPTMAKTITLPVQIDGSGRQMLTLYLTQSGFSSIVIPDEQFTRIAEEIAGRINYAEECR